MYLQQEQCRSPPSKKPNSRSRTSILQAALKRALKRTKLAARAIALIDRPEQASYKLSALPISRALQIGDDSTQLLACSTCACGESACCCLVIRLLYGCQKLAVMTSFYSFFVQESCGLLLEPHAITASHDMQMQSTLSHNLALTELLQCSFVGC